MSNFSKLRNVLSIQKKTKTSNSSALFIFKTTESTEFTTEKILQNGTIMQATVYINMRKLMLRGYAFESYRELEKKKKNSFHEAVRKLECIFKGQRETAGNSTGSSIMLRISEHDGCFLNILLKMAFPF